MVKTFEYKIKICKTTDKKKLAGNKVKNYDYGTISIRKPELSGYIGKTAKVKVSVSCTGKQKSESE